MRRAPQEGQKPRRLHENATSFSWPHSLQCRRRNPCARMPHARKASNSADPAGRKHGAAPPHQQHDLPRRPRQRRDSRRPEKRCGQRVGLGRARLLLRAVVELAPLREQIEDRAGNYFFRNRPAGVGKSGIIQRRSGVAEQKRRPRAFALLDDNQPQCHSE